MANKDISFNRGVSTNIFDARAMAVGVGVFLLICVGLLVWRIAARVDTTKRSEVVKFDFGLRDHQVEESFKLSDPVRGIEKETFVDTPTAMNIPEQKPKIHMTASPVPSNIPVYREVISSPNTSVNTTMTDLSAISAKDVAAATKTETTITDGPEEITVTAEDVGYAINQIAVEVQGPADIFKYNTPTPRDRPAMYTFNQGPRPGRYLKQLPKSFGDQTTPSWGTPGPMNINLWGTEGHFLNLMGRSGMGIKARSSVDSALHWLATHQGEDGLWPSDKYEGGKQTSLANTGLSVLALMGGGNTTRKGEYRRSVIKGIEAILRHQNAEGLISMPGANFYTHSICTIALCESYGRARDERVGSAAQKAIDFAIKAAGADGGWRYAKNPPASDMSVTAWFIQALKTAKLAQIKFDDQVMAKAKVYLDSCTDQGGTKDSSGGVGYMFQDGQSYGPGHPALTCAGMLLRQFTGTGVKNHLLIKGAELTKARPPRWQDKDFYYWYYATYAMHNMGGEYRIWWNQKIRDVLVEKQSRDGDNAGSWDPKGDKWGSHGGGRVYVTALGALCLEVYYRYSEALTSFGVAPDLDELLLE
jgi:hypothetical protein